MSPDAIWLIAYYVWIHFCFIQHNKAYKDRTVYEKIVTVVAWITMWLFLMWTIWTQLY